MTDSVQDQPRQQEFRDVKTRQRSTLTMNMLEGLVLACAAVIAGCTEGPRAPWAI